jgi:hypothetical protein
MRPTSVRPHPHPVRAEVSKPRAGLRYRRPNGLGRTCRALALLIASAFTACTAPPPEASHFPLEAGHRWVYDVKTEWENNTVEHETRTIETLGRETIEGGAAWRRRSDSGVDYWLRSDESGLYRVASKSDVQAEPQPDPAKRYVLKSPLAVGTQWQASTTPYLLHRRQDFPREIRHTHPNVPMNYSIEAVSETLATRAGEFSDCLRVKGVAVLRLYADPVVGWKDMPITTTEWYCKGVGLARLVREEPAQSTFLGGGTQTLELVAWR